VVAVDRPAGPQAGNAIGVAVSGVIFYARVGDGSSDGHSNSKKVKRRRRGAKAAIHHLSAPTPPPRPSSDNSKKREAQPSRLQGSQMMVDQ
jgi:hypothetical protein